MSAKKRKRKPPAAAANCSLAPGSAFSRLAHSVVTATVRETGEVRQVFYVRRDMLHDEKGRICMTPLELAHAMQHAISNRDKTAVASLCWDALSFVHNGNVPPNALHEAKRYGATPLAI